MKCELTNPTTGIKDTPLRMLIKSFPELANNVFDKCMRTNLQGSLMGFSEVKLYRIVVLCSKMSSYVVNCRPL